MVPSISDLIRETTGIDLSKVVKPARHPLDDLTPAEITSACSVVKRNRPGLPLWVKVATLREPVSRRLGVY